MPGPYVMCVFSVALLLLQGIASGNAPKTPRPKFSGLPFSASFVDIAREAGLTKKLVLGRPDKKKICESAIEAERIIHKNSSGADCFVSTFGGLIHYSRRGGFRKVDCKIKLPLVIGNTGIKHNTGELVSSVRKLKEANQMAFGGLMSQARDICKQALAALGSGNIDNLGVLMNESQLLLSRLGVSHEKVDDLIDVARRYGAIGAKMTGAGGGGAIIALAANGEDSEQIEAGIKSAGYTAFRVEIDPRGLIVG